MKKTIITIIVITILFSCGKDKQKDEPGLFDLIEGVSDLNKVAKEAEKIEEDNKKLLKTTPITNEELKALLPATLIGYPRKKFSIGNQFMPDVVMGEAQYENENGVMISFSILDGAGETGSSMITLTRLGFARDFEEENDRGYKKSTTLGDYKAIEEIERDEYDNSVNSKLDLIISNRFIVSLEGNNVPMEKLKDAIKELNLNALEQKAD